MTIETAKIGLECYQTSLEASRLLKTYRRKMDKLKADSAAFMAALEKDGWQRFDYYSCYHEETISSQRAIFMFRPGIDISRWKDAVFASGLPMTPDGRSEDAVRFSEWIGRLHDGSDYFVFGPDGVVEFIDADAGDFPAGGVA